MTGCRGGSAGGRTILQTMRSFLPLKVRESIFLSRQEGGLLSREKNNLPTICMPRREGIHSELRE